MFSAVHRFWIWWMRQTHYFFMPYNQSNWFTSLWKVMKKHLANLSISNKRQYNHSSVPETLSGTVRQIFIQTFRQSISGQCLILINFLHPLSFLLLFGKWISCMFCFLIQNWWKSTDPELTEAKTDLFFFNVSSVMQSDFIAWRFTIIFTQVSNAPLLGN